MQPCFHNKKGRDTSSHCSNWGCMKTLHFGGSPGEHAYDLNKQTHISNINCVNKVSINLLLGHMLILSGPRFEMAKNKGVENHRQGIDHQL